MFEIRINQFFNPLKFVLICDCDKRYAFYSDLPDIDELVKDMLYEQRKIYRTILTVEV